MKRKTTDQYYKTIFSSVEPLRQLLEGFVPLPWIKRLDFSRAELPQLANANVGKRLLGWPRR